MAKRELTLQSGTNLLGDENMKLSDDDKISKMYVPQGGANECWFASCMMVWTYIKGTAINYNEEKDEVKGLIAASEDTTDYFTDGGNAFTILVCLNQTILGNLQYDFTYPSDIVTIQDEINYSLSQDLPVILGIEEPSHYVVITTVGDVHNNTVDIEYFDPNDSPFELKQGCLSIQNASLSLNYMFTDTPIKDLIRFPNPNKK
jgi:hypothetical protein